MRHVRGKGYDFFKIRWNPNLYFKMANMTWMGLGILTVLVFGYTLIQSFISSSFFYAIAAFFALIVGGGITLFYWVSKQAKTKRKKVIQMKVTPLWTEVVYMLDKGQFKKVKLKNSMVNLHLRTESTHNDNEIYHLELQTDKTKNTYYIYGYQGLWDDHNDAKKIHKAITKYYQSESDQDEEGFDFGIIEDIIDVADFLSQFI